MCSRRWSCCKSPWDAPGETWAWNLACSWGHGLGEYAAACLAGVLTLADTLRLVTARAGAARSLGRRDANRLGGGRRGAAQLGPDGLDAFREVAQQITYRRPQWPYLSGMTGTWAADEVATPDYWCRHLRHPVRFHDALQCAAQVAPNAYLEIGAGSTLAALVRSSLPDTAADVLPGLQGDDQEWTAHLTLLGRLYVGGAALAWPAVWGTPRRRVALPSYPFQRQRYWFTGDEYTVPSSRGTDCQSVAEDIDGLAITS